MQEQRKKLINKKRKLILLVYAKLDLHHIISFLLIYMNFFAYGDQ